MKEKILQIKNYFVTFVWLIIVSCTSYILSLCLRNQFDNKLNKIFAFLKIYGIALYSIIILIFFISGFVLFSINNKLRIQKIRNQPSYIFYLYWVSIFLLWGFILFKCVSPAFVNCNVIIGIFGVFALPVIIYYFYPAKRLIGNKRFAAGAVGLTKDKLAFTESARNVAHGIAVHNEKDYLAVYALYGDVGFGKSSYIRMIVETLEDEKYLGIQNLLYTYISLTETNAAKDFSRLFSDRWVETLTERYPSISIGSITPILTSIFRESNSNFLADLFSFINVYNKGLYRTKAKTHDFYLDTKPKYVSETIGSMFMQSQTHS